MGRLRSPFLLLRVRSHKQEWWEDTGLPPLRPRVPRSFRGIDPVHSQIELPRRLLGKVGAFGSSHKWTPFSRIHSIDIGYLVPVYDLKAIACRYRLGRNSSIYFKKYILPEPFDTVRRRSVASHHWSRYTLTALDVVLKDLERLGYQQFLKRFDQHIDNLHAGNEYLEDHYRRQFEEKEFKIGDKYGVSWLE